MIGAKKLPVEETTEEQKPQETKIDSIDTSVVFSKDVMIEKFNKYIEGSNWTVTYYSQLNAENDNATVLDRNAIEALQQFEKIINLNLKVSTPLDVARMEEVTGEATVAVGIEPTQGDVFIAELDNKQIAIFRVDTVEYELYNLNKIFKITYKLDFFISKDMDVYKDLESKVVREFVYDPDMYRFNSEAILPKDVYFDKLLLVDELNHLQLYYGHKFIDDKTKAFMYTVNNKNIIDPYHEAFIFKIFDYEYTLELNRANRFPLMQEDALYDTIYAPLLYIKKDMMDYINDSFNIIDRRNFPDIPALKTGRYFNIDYVVYRENYTGNSFDIFEYLEDKDYKHIPDRKEEKRLLFSNDLYINKEYKSDIEKLLLNYLDNKELDINILSTLIKEIRSYDLIDQYYYIPILVLFIKYYLGNIRHNEVWQ